MASRSAREVAYETIRSRIITMDLKPGDELNDRELAQELGISRTPMREALIMLNIAHMVVIKPQSGTHVAPIDLKLMEMEQFARFTLEKELLNHIRGRLTGAAGDGQRGAVLPLHICAKRLHAFQCGGDVLTVGHVLKPTGTGGKRTAHDQPVPLTF